MNKQDALKTYSDERLMLEYKLGNSNAFGVLYERHAQKLYGYLAKKLSGNALVDEVFQESLLKLHAYRERYDATFPFLPWLFTLSRNVMIDHLRKGAREQQVQQEGRHQWKETPPDVREHLAALSGKESVVIEMQYFQGYSLEEVAQHLKIAPANARKISSRAIQKLRTLFGSGL